MSIDNREVITIYDASSFLFKGEEYDVLLERRRLDIAGAADRKPRDAGVGV